MKSELAVEIVGERGGFGAAALLEARADLGLDGDEGLDQGGGGGVGHDAAA